MSTESMLRYQSATDGLVRDLRAAGFSDLEMLTDLRRIGTSAAVSPLVNWLPRIEYLPAEQDLLAMLGCAWAAGPEAVGVLLQVFEEYGPHNDPEDGRRWVAGQSLEKHASLRWLDDFLRIASNADHGSARGGIVLALGRLRRARDSIVPTLAELLDDPSVELFAVAALGSLHATEMREAIELRTRRTEPRYREIARMALRKLDRASSRRERADRSH